MSNEELVQRIRAGETELIIELWNNCKRFIYKMANRYLDYEEFEDLVQIGFFAMLKAIEYYKPEYSFLSTLAFSLRNAFRSRLKRQEMISLSEPLSADEDSGTFADIIPDPYDYFAPMEQIVWLEQLHEALESALKDLSMMQRKVLRLRYYKGLTADQTAERLHKKYSEIRSIEVSAIRKIRMRASKYGLEHFIEEEQSTRDKSADWAKEKI